MTTLEVSLSAVSTTLSHKGVSAPEGFRETILSSAIIRAMRQERRKTSEKGDTLEKRSHLQIKWDKVAPTQKLGSQCDSLMTSQVPYSWISWLSTAGDLCEVGNKGGSLKKEFPPSRKCLEWLGWDS